MIAWNNRIPPPDAEASIGYQKYNVAIEHLESM